VSKAVVEELFVLEIIYDTLAALTQDIDASISMEVTLDDGQQRCTASYDCSIQRSTKIVEVLFEDNIKVIYSIHEQEGSVIDHDHFIGKFSENALYETITPNNPLHIFSDYFSFVYSIILKLVELYQYELCLHNTKTKSGIDNRRIQCIREYKCVVKGQSPADWVIESI
jgi:hypothetical protein